MLLLLRAGSNILLQGSRAILLKILLTLPFLLLLFQLLRLLPRLPFLLTGCFALRFGSASRYNALSFHRLLLRLLQVFLLTAFLFFLLVVQLWLLLLGLVSLVLPLLLLVLLRRRGFISTSFSWPQCRWRLLLLEQQPLLLSSLLFLHFHSLLVPLLLLVEARVGNLHRPYL